MSNNPHCRRVPTLREAAGGRAGRTMVTKHLNVWGNLRNDSLQTERVLIGSTYELTATSRVNSCAAQDEFLLVNKRTGTWVLRVTESEHGGQLLELNAKRLRLADLPELRTVEETELMPAGSLFRDPNGMMRVTTADTAAPVITVTGDNPVTVALNAVYSDAGATTDDDEVAVTATGDVDTSAAGTYTVTYTAADWKGNAAVPKTRTVIVE